MISSPKTYNIIREANILQLPSQRTLKDYTHWFKQDIGFQNEMSLQLYEDHKICEWNESQRYLLSHLLMSFTMQYVITLKLIGMWC